MSFKTTEERPVYVTCTSECDVCFFTHVEKFEATDKKRSSEPPKGWVSLIYSCSESRLTQLWCPECAEAFRALRTQLRADRPTSAPPAPEAPHQDEPPERVFHEIGPDPGRPPRPLRDQA